MPRQGANGGSPTPDGGRIALRRARRRACEPGLPRPWNLPQLDTAYRRWTLFARCGYGRERPPAFPLARAPQSSAQKATFAAGEVGTAARAWPLWVARRPV